MGRCHPFIRKHSHQYLNHVRIIFPQHTRAFCLYFHLFATFLYWLFQSKLQLDCPVLSCPVLLSDSTISVIGHANVLVTLTCLVLYVQTTFQSYAKLLLCFKLQNVFTPHKSIWCSVTYPSQDSSSTLHTI